MEKKYKNGLVLGKFMPPTAGHLHLISTAEQYCDNVFVMICSDETQPIPGELRYGWLQQIYKHNEEVHVIWCQDVNPQHPSETPSLDEFYQNYWVPSVKSRLQSLDAIFTSEEYGDEFASYLDAAYPGIEHFSVDQPRATYDISATRVRTDPFKYWNFIPRAVRPYYYNLIKKIVVMGPESTGKSTLVHNLANHFKTNASKVIPNWVDEYGRTYSEVHGMNLTQEDFDLIAMGHRNMIRRGMSYGHKQIFVDTEAMTTKIFGEIYVPNYDTTVIDGIIKEQQFDLYLLTDIDVPYVHDETRRSDEERKGHLERIKAELAANGIEYTLITGNWEERLKQAIKAVEEIIVAESE